MVEILTPRETKNLDIYGNPPLEWNRLVATLDGIRDLEVSDAASHYWLATVRPDGRPHVMGVGIVWDDGRFYLVSGPRTQKSRTWRMTRAAPSASQRPAWTSWPRARQR
jgi:hypothetical protein